VTDQTYMNHCYGAVLTETQHGHGRPGAADSGRLSLFNEFQELEHTYTN
jgi:hypothetical protein